MHRKHPLMRMNFLLPPLTMNGSDLKRTKVLLAEDCSLRSIQMEDYRWQQTIVINDSMDSGSAGMIADKLVIQVALLIIFHTANGRPGIQMDNCVRYATTIRRSLDI